MRPLEGRPLLSYPCTWTYRIVCTDEPGLRALIAELVGEEEHALASLGGSASGRYARLELVLTVRDEAHRNHVFAALSRASMVRFVL